LPDETGGFGNQDGIRIENKCVHSLGTAREFAGSRLRTQQGASGFSPALKYGFEREQFPRQATSFAGGGE
jgi:hypothetical protein